MLLLEENTASERDFRTKHYNVWRDGFWESNKGENKTSANEEAPWIYYFLSRK